MKEEERRSETDKVNGHLGSVIYRRLSLVSFNSSTPKHLEGFSYLIFARAS